VRIVQGAMRAKARRRLIVRSIVAAGTLAAALALYVNLGHRASPLGGSTQATSTITGEELSGDVVTVHGKGAEVPFEVGGSVGVGDRVLTRSGSKAQLRLPTGTKLLVEEKTDLGVVEQGPTHVFALAVGALRADVAKLRDGERFIVRTSDAEVEVRGTAFRLARVAGGGACSGATTTRLSVFEGVVVVRFGERENRVAAGEEWNAECAGPGRAETRAREAPSSPETKAPSGPSDRASNAGAAPRGLQPINDLFAAAMDAKRRGDKQRALAALQRLEVQYPSSHLAESATVERMKILVTVDPTAAAVAARAYLDRYADGFARDLAESIVAKGR
jgi:ferric-dicitrate binding protein FerR (iron transport regulator)